MADRPVPMGCSSTWPELRELRRRAMKRSRIRRGDVELLQWVIHMWGPGAG
jgi:hypothetical protein